MDEILVPLFFFASVFGFPLLRRQMIHRHQMERLTLDAGRPTPSSAPTGGPASAADLALQLPEPHRLYALALLCRLQDAPASTEPRTLFVLCQARDTYLPETLRAYLHLTPAGRQQLALQGHSPEALLQQQLALINQAATEALGHDHAAANRLLTQGRFLLDQGRVLTPVSADLA
ncbi:hypothetical protein [Deinococcus arcticus]|uniref:Uncharacterized protein n=1 Tax=Deinococcus arcticus TaxID=2136176 RepID=A0A2T3WBU2_9DEIO|nr:hypothetical protein [Deinococcus arcticus]PTA69375.1 hypothetical protein C8263_03375 [Deinococcus arcticus]